MDIESGRLVNYKHPDPDTIRTDDACSGHANRGHFNRLYINIAGDSICCNCKATVLAGQGYRAGSGKYFCDHHCFITYMFIAAF